MPEEKELIFHNDAISCFKNELYTGIFTQENIASPKKCITIGQEKFYGYFLEKNKEKYFAPDAFVKIMPFKVVTQSETDYKGEVFNFVTKVQSIVIPSEKKMGFRQLIDTIGAFNHTNPFHWTLHKICTVAAYSDRVNFRVSTEPGFGKDSAVNIIQHLVNSTVNLYGATFAKLEYVLMNKLIVLNEMGNLKKDDLMNMQEFLLAVGAYFNMYTKRTRKTNTTQEEYDISRLSLVIFYNLPSHYTNKAQEYFDQLFTKAVINRFIPFVFEGRITTQFEKCLDPQSIAKKYTGLYKDVIATLNYYKEHPLTSIKYNVPKEIQFNKTLMRYDRSFNTILKYVAEYAENQDEFDVMAKELFKCYEAYGKLIGPTLLELK